MNLFTIGKMRKQQDFGRRKNKISWYMLANVENKEREDMIVIAQAERPSCDNQIWGFFIMTVYC
jgi:hypothetical protein